MRMLPVILNEVYDANTVSKLAIVGLDACFKHFIVIRSVVNVQILIRVFCDGF